MAKELDDAQAVVSMSTAALQALVASAVEAAVNAARQPVRDPARELRTAAARARMRAQIQIARTELQARYEACSHLRPDGTSVIAWGVQSDGLTRGFCQHCQMPCNPKALGEKEYRRLLKIPTVQAGIVTLNQLGG